MYTWLTASSLYCMLINKNRHFMLKIDIVTAVFWEEKKQTLFSVVSFS